MIKAFCERLVRWFRREKPLMYTDAIRCVGQDHTDPGAGGFHVPPGVQPLVVRTETATIPGIQPLRFVRKVVALKTGDVSKLEAFEINRNVLRGCGCVVTSPNEVAYMSDLSGLPVCRRCAATCICGHKVAPSERVMIQPRVYICMVCQEAQMKAQKRAQFWRTILGPFYS